MKNTLRNNNNNNNNNLIEIFKKLSERLLSIRFISNDFNCVFYITFK